MEKGRDDSLVSKDNEAPEADVEKEADEEKIVYNPAFSNSIFEFIIQYKDTKIFQWVHRHPRLSILIIVIWGIIILSMFFVFLYRIMSLI